MTRTIACLSLALALAGAAGCADRMRLTPGHGRSVHAAFGRQTVNPEAGKQPRPMAGLDAQEASAVAANYKRSLVTKDSQPRDQGNLLVLPAPSNGQPYVPPPSVPAEQK